SDLRDGIDAEGNLFFAIGVAIAFAEDGLAANFNEDVAAETLLLHRIGHRRFDGGQRLALCAGKRMLGNCRDAERGKTQLHDSASAFARLRRCGRSSRLRRRIDCGVTSTSSSSSM